MTMSCSSGGARSDWEAALAELVDWSLVDCHRDLAVQLAAEPEHEQYDVPGSDCARLSCLSCVCNRRLEEP